MKINSSKKVLKSHEKLDQYSPSMAHFFCFLLDSSGKNFQII